MTWLKKFLTHYVLYAVLLLVLCLGIFPFIILYSSSMSIAELLDRVAPQKKLAQRLENFWTVIGTPYDYLVKTVG
jgi:ABC-type glycerol-3-phosphate transport system permease component